MILYFLRHGPAGDKSTWQGDDRLRPLTEKGKNVMAREAETIASLKLDLELILTSPLVRAYQTAEIVARRLEMIERCIREEKLSPGCDLPALEQILRDHPGAKRLMLVGHEPDFSGMIGGMIGGGRVVCKKGGLARVDVSGEKPLQGELVWLFTPEVLAE